MSLADSQTLAGRYQIRRLLGSGGMGDVYEALDTTLNISVALKLIRGSRDSESVRRLQRELLTARSVTHPNVCRVYDFDVDLAAGPFFTMQFLQGRTLAERLATDGPLPLPEARRIALSVVDALDAAHAAGVVHRDLKPGNIFLLDDGRVVVTDFGLARPMQNATDATATLTAVAGTPAYMAPEQIAGAALTAAIDLYALGIVMYEMTTGRRPGPDSSRTSLDPAWDAAIAGCLRHSPAERFRSATDVRDALARRPVALPRKRILAGTAVVLTVAALASFALSRRTYIPNAEAVSWYDRGLRSLQDGDAQSAARQFEQAVRADSAFVMAQARLAEAWAEQDYSDRARQTILKATAASQQHRVSGPDALRLQAIHLTAARDYPAAAARYREIARQQKTSAGLFELARALERNNQAPDAIATYRQAVQADPTHAAAWARFGALLGRTGQADDAHRALDRAEQIHKTSGNLTGVAEVQYRRARLLNTQGQIERADDILRDAVQVAKASGFESQRIRMLFLRGAIARRLDRTEEAEKLLAEGLEVAQANRMESLALEGLHETGNVALQKQEYAVAERHFQRALSLAEQQESHFHAARARAQIASVWEQQAKPDAARPLAESALEFFRKSGYRVETLSVLALLAQIKTRAGDIEGALAAFREQLPLIPPSNARAVAAVQLRIGANLLSLDRLSEASPHLEAAARAPDVTTKSYAVIGLAELATRTGALDEARRLLSDAKVFGDPAGALAVRADHWKAAVELTALRHADAARILRSAIERLGDRDPVLRTRLRVDLAVALARAGDANTANRICDEALRETLAPAARANSLNACATVALLTRRFDVASARAAEAQERLQALRKPEGAWQACVTGAIARAGGKSLAAATNCETMRKIVAEGWGPKLYARYLTRPDIRRLVGQVSAQ